MACSLAKRLLSCACQMEWIVTVTRRPTTNILHLLPGFSSCVGACKPFGTLHQWGRQMNPQKHNSLTTYGNNVCSGNVHSSASSATVCSPVKRPMWIHHVRRCTPCTDFSTAAHSCSQFGMGQERNVDSRASSFASHDWALKLANENGYLSWCRNTYLSTVVAIAMMGEGSTAMAEHAAEAAFLVAGLNLSWGTYQYIYNLLHIRHKTGMSAAGGFCYVSMALMHLALWFMVCSLYLGYNDDEDEGNPELKDPENGDDD